MILNKSIWTTLVIFLFLFILPQNLSATQETPKSYDANYYTMHHILDGYSWDFFKKKDGSYAAVYLPRILWNKNTNRLDFFKNTSSAIENGYISLYDELKHYPYNEYIIKGRLLSPQAKSKLNRILEIYGNASTSDEIDDFNAAVNSAISTYKPLDFSITKNVLYMIFAFIILLWIFISIARRYQKYPDQTPKGLQSLLEPVILFVRDDIARPQIKGDRYERYMPLLLTFFFFILILNLLGLTPMASNASGNIAFTASLAFITLLVVNFSAKKDYWKHIFWFPGVPLPFKLLMMIVELMGLIAKPFALTIRLFAVVTAGHIIIVSLIALIFVMGEMGTNPVGGYGISIVSVAFGLFINLLELLVGTIQAYVFTLLSAAFIGQALEEHHHEEHEIKDNELKIETT